MAKPLPTGDGDSPKPAPRPVYPQIIREARRGIQDSLSYVEDLRARLEQSLEQLDEIEAHLDRKVCPFCGGQMVNLAPLGELTTGRELTQGGTVLDPYERYSWECQSCTIYATFRPYGVSMSWERENFTGKDGRTFAARVFQHFAAATQVTYTRRSGEWHLLIDNDWYRFVGTAKSVLEQLGIR